MFTQEEKNKKINEIDKYLTEIINFSIENDLIRTNVLGSALNFGVCKEIFEKIINITAEIKDGPYDQLPFNKLNTLFEQTRAVTEKLNQIKNFNPETQSSERTNLIMGINDVFETYYSHIFEILSHIKIQKFKPSEFEKEVKTKLKTVRDITNEANKKLTEINDILSKTKQVAGKTGVTEYATYFKEEASEHSQKSNEWLRAVVVMSLVVVGWGIILMFWIKRGLTTGEAVQYAIAKFIVLSALFYILVWVTKNYNAHRHNYIVNKHRSNSLNSFETFVKSTEDPTTKDAVLLQATQSIFSPQPSGYDNGGNEGDPSNKFIETLRYFEPKK
jgi:hypothetical protein